MLYYLSSLLKVVTLVLLLVLNCLLGALNVANTTKKVYTYSNDDYPIEAPIEGLNRVLMTQFVGTHFQLNASDHTSSLEWRSIYSGPYTMHLGSEARVFLIAMYHETHCLRAMEYSFLHPTSSAYSPEHIQHCLNYLRQHFLCTADDQVESGDFISWDLSVGYVYNKNRVCRDWEGVRRAAGDNLEIFTHSM
ncbi:hypothetical protein CPC08DRAFT_670185 [Agrocybe pediades]|nr:hypothetical protein CPC08DRAFT_670185 [Agrocybe pediades]